MGQLGFEVFSGLLLLKEVHMVECLVLVPHLATADITPTVTSLGIVVSWLYISCVMNYPQISD